jgi:hypothetical protein
MMNCSEFRRAFGADPRSASAESSEHRAQCPACERFAQETLRLDGLIKRALELPVPAARPIALPRSTKPAPTRWYAMAASVLLAVGIGAFWFFGVWQDTLASDVVDLLKHEPDALQSTNERVSATLLDAVLRSKGAHLSAPIDGISYSTSCQFRKRVVPHLVVQTSGGPVTVMILAEESVASAHHFDERQYHGVQVPMQKGSPVVIASDASVVDAVADRVRTSIVWN